MPKFEVYEVQMVSRLTTFVHEVEAATQEEAVRLVREGEANDSPVIVHQCDEEYGPSGFGARDVDALNEWEELEDNNEWDESDFDWLLGWTRVDPVDCAGASESLGRPLSEVESRVKFITTLRDEPGAEKLTGARVLARWKAAGPH